MNVRHVQIFGGFKRPTTICLIPVLAVLFTFYSQCRGQQAAGSVVPTDPTIRWAVGPQKLSLGDYADIDIPSGFRMTDAHGARIILDSFNSPVPLPLIGAFSDTAGKWWAVMEYSPKGFVKDGEQINSAAVLKALQGEMQPGASLNWHSSPVYDPQMHSLSWSLEAKNGSKNQLSQTIVLLGRNGYVTIISYQANPAGGVSPLKQLAGSINFKDGQRYADFQSGDEVARVGLSDLIVGERHTAKAGMGHGFAGVTAAWVYSGIFVCVLVGGVMLVRRKKASTVSKTSSPAHVAVPAAPAVAVKPSAPPVPAPATVAGNGHQNGAVSAKVPEQKKIKHFHRNRRKKIFNYPKFYTNVMRELSLHSYGPGHYVNGKNGSNGHANGHANGASNGHANGHANGHGNGASSNGSTGVNDAIKAEIAALIANQKNLIEEQKCLLEQQTKLIAEKRWLIEEQSAFLKGQSEQQFPLKFE